MQPAKDIKGKFANQNATLRNKECLLCKKIFYCRYGEGLGRWEKKIYCSNDCNWKSKYNGNNINCLSCGKEFYINAKAPNKYCSKQCANKAMIGKIPINAWKKGDNVSTRTQFKKGEVRISGENNNFWKGGIYPLHLKLRKTPEYLKWRDSVKERDNYTCQICGKIGGYLHSDHIKPFALYPQLRTDINNGRTLCVPCHQKTDTYGKKTQLKR